MTATPPSSAGEGGPRVQPGEVVSGKFRIERVLGQGGMGVVVAARHLQLDETVALKFLRAHAIADRDALGRFTREARAAAKLKSEHVARVLDAGVTDDGAPYIVMEYLEGRNLGQVVEHEGRLDVPTACEFVIQACEGLAEAHARGIVHRDIKPENLFLVERSQGWRLVKILDFGISKFATLEPLETGNIATQSMMGSPCYMSPEQLRSTASVDHRSDIWSLGVTMFELLAGVTAYSAGQTLPQLVAAILESPPPRLADRFPEMPPDLSQVVERCMAKDRAARFGTAAELALALLPFAPKRSRANVEKAVAITQSPIASAPSQGGAASGPPGLSSAPPKPGSNPRAIAPVALAQGTLRSATLAKAPADNNLDTLAAPTMTASHGRGASHFAVAVAALGIAGILLWGIAQRRAPAPAIPSSTPAVVAPPPSLLGSVPEVASAAMMPGPVVAPSALSVEPGPPSGAPPGSSAPRPAHHPPGPPPRASSTPAPSPPSGLDIRMER